MLWGGSPLHKPRPPGRGIGRVLMVAVMDQVKDANVKPLTFRLTQVAVNTASFCLCASLGFNACGNLLEFHGVPSQTKLPIHRSHDQLVEIRPLAVLINT